MYRAEEQGGPVLPTLMQT
jgi:hypothetical protein